MLPPSVPECFLRGRGALYRPGILGTVQLHFVRSKDGLDHWQTIHWLTLLDESESKPDWSSGHELSAPAIDAEPEAGVAFAGVPVEATREKALASWQKSLQTFLYRERRLTLFDCKELDATSNPGESEADFRVRLGHRLRERRDFQ